MALDFPASPSVNQTYSGPGGVVWVWDGAKWVSGTGSTVYAPVTSPVFLGNPTAPNPPAGDADTSVATTSFVAAAVGTALHDIGRNLLHNPLFNVAQRGAGPFTATPANTPVYAFDRWACVAGGDAYTIAPFAHSDANRAAIGDEEALQFPSNGFTGGAAAGNYCELFQRIENVRRLANKTITVSFWANAGSVLTLGVNLSQFFGTGGSPSAPVLVGAKTVSLSTTWTRYSLSFGIPSVAGKTFGTTAGTDFTQLEFWLSSGSTNAARAGVGVQSGTINIWGVQLEIGSVATPLEKPDPRYDLANCQRFYQNIAGVQEGGYAATGGAITISSLKFSTMRAAPTIGFSAQTYNNCGALTTNPTSPNSVNMYVTATGAGTFWVSYGATLSADL